VSAAGRVGRTDGRGSCYEFRMRNLFWMVSCAFVLAACGGDKSPAPPAAAEPAPAPAAPAAPTPAEAAPAPKAEAAAKPEATDRVEEAMFALALKPTGAYAAGKLGSFEVTIEPRGEWHINMDFPTEVTVKSGEGITLPKASLDKKAAAEFKEELARFDIPFTAAAAGEHEVECNVRFAMCSEENCVPEERTVVLALNVL